MELSNLRNATTESGKKLIDLGFQYAAIWPVLNAKFSTNVNSLKLKPTVQTPISNLYFATAYTKVTQEMYLMDVAFEAGTKAAWKIMESYKHSYKPSDKELTRKHTPRNLSWLTWPVRSIDYFSYKAGGEHPSEWFAGNTIAVIVIAWLFVFAFLALIIVITVYATKCISSKKSHHA